MPKRGLGAQVAVFAVVVVFVVVAFGLVSLAQPGSTSGSTTSSNGVTQATFLYRTMPKEFAVGGYKFYMGYNGTGFATDVNGSLTVNSGFNLELTVSNGLTNQTTVFGWAPPAPSPGALPTPDKASLFGGGVELDWFTDSAGTYLQVSTSISSASAGAGNSSNTAVATVTATETLYAGSQVTTVYARPTTNCTIVGLTTMTITTTTITVGAASTTTVTVTTTSTVYNLTATVTSCTYSVPTVTSTSTVTTTVNSCPPGLTCPQAPAGY